MELLDRYTNNTWSTINPSNQENVTVVYSNNGRITMKA
jgi:hypothetical protein